MKLGELIRQVPRSVVLASAVASLASGAAAGLLLSVVRSTTEAGVDRSRRLLEFGGLVLVYCLTVWIVQWFVPLLAEVPLKDLRLRLCRQVLNTPFATMERVGIGRVLGVMSEDLQGVTLGLAALPRCFTALVIMGTSVVYLGILSPLGMTLFLMISVAAIVSDALLDRVTASEVERAIRTRREFYAQTSNLLTGGKELRLNRNLRRQVFLGTIEPLAEAVTTLAKRWLRIDAVARALNGVWTWLFIGLTMFLLPVVRPHLAGSTLSSLLIVALYLMAPIEIIRTSVLQVVRARHALRSVTELGFKLDAPARFLEVPEPDPVPFSRSLELRGVTHRFYREKEDDLFTLGPIDLTIEPGERLFITGGNGSGKSTLAKILAGLYPPESGELRLDDQTITVDNVEEYRQQLAAVFSEFHVFPHLVSPSDDSATIDRKGNELLETFHLGHKVTVRDRKLSTVDLSSGQRKRLALVATFLQERPIHIFDEWAADQDPVFKEIFYTDILDRLKREGRTCIVVTHDDRYFGHADRIVRMESGRIESIGSPPPRR